jgi:hypothetical protein
MEATEFEISIAAKAKGLLFSISLHGLKTVAINRMLK